MAHGKALFARALLAGSLLSGGPGGLHAQDACGSGESELGGRLSDGSTGVALPGVEVTISWTSRDGEAGSGVATTALDGGFALCLPHDATGVRARAALGAMEGPAVDIAWPTTDEVELVLGLQSDDPGDVGSIVARTETLEGDRGASIRGRVWDSAADQAVPGARVDLDDGGRTALTDATGSFILGSVTPGQHVLRVEHLGYATLIEPVTARVGQITSLSVRLAPEAVEVEPLVVSVFRDIRLDRVGFYDRKERGELLGIGRFLGQEEIERSSSPRVSQLLDNVQLIDMIRVCSVTCLTVPRVVGAPPRMVSRGGGSAPCPADVYIDGTRVRLWRWMGDNSLDLIAGIDEFLTPTGIAGIEVYRRASELPAEFGGATDGCGAVVIWTR